MLDLASKSRSNGLSPIVLALPVALFLLLLIVMGGRDGLVDSLWTLPVLRSLHVPTRFLYLLAIALTSVGVTALAAALPGRGQARAFGVGMCAAVTLLAFAAGYPASTVAQMQLTTDDARITADLREAPVPPAVVRVQRSAWMLGGDTSLDCYEPLFDTVGRDAIDRLQVGPVGLVSEGAFNMINPACWQYPEENGCSPGDRIAREDWANLSRLTASRATTWALSDRQRTADRLTLLGLAAAIGTLGAATLSRRGHGRAGSRGGRQ